MDSSASTAPVAEAAGPNSSAGNSVSTNACKVEREFIAVTPANVASTATGARTRNFRRVNIE